MDINSSDLRAADRLRIDVLHVAGNALLRLWVQLDLSVGGLLSSGLDRATRWRAWTGACTWWPVTRPRTRSMSL